MMPFTQILLGSRKTRASRQKYTRKQHDSGHFLCPELMRQRPRLVATWVSN